MQLDEAFAKLKIVQDIIPAGNSNRPGTRITATKITIHNTDNDSPGANAAAHARYQKGADARARQVSWHFTVDDKGVFQSLPTNEKGFHAGSGEGNRTSIGIEICMHPEMDVTAAYDRAALLVAVMAMQLGVPVSDGIKQHNYWTGKNCPRVLRSTATGWSDFLAKVRGFRQDLEPVHAAAITFAHEEADGAPRLASPRGRAKSVRRVKSAARPRKSSDRAKTQTRRTSRKRRR